MRAQAARTVEAGVQAATPPKSCRPDAKGRRPPATVQAVRSSLRQARACARARPCVARRGQRGRYRDAGAKPLMHTCGGILSQNGLGPAGLALTRTQSTRTGRWVRKNAAHFGPGNVEQPSRNILPGGWAWGAARAALRKYRSSARDGTHQTIRPAHVWVGGAVSRSCINWNWCQCGMRCDCASRTR